MILIFLQTRAMTDFIYVTSPHQYCADTQSVTNFPTLHQGTEAMVLSTVHPISLFLGPPRDYHDKKLRNVKFNETIRRRWHRLKCVNYSEDKSCLTGPTGKILLLPPAENAVHIMVATGTGIAPYRAYLRRMFMEEVPDYKFTGLAWLFMGVANSDAKLYDDEFQAIAKKHPKQVCAYLTHEPWWM